MKVPTGPRNAKVRLEEVFEDLEGIKTRLGLKQRLSQVDTQKVNHRNGKIGFHLASNVLTSRVCQPNGLGGLRQVEEQALA